MYKYPNGDVYLGKGKYLYINGNNYTGEWYNDKKDG